MRLLRKFLFEKKQSDPPRCFSCGTPLKGGDSTCPNCSSSETRTCEVCGESLVKDYVYCPNCGVHLPCPVCGAVVEGQNCASCGTNFDNAGQIPLFHVLGEGQPYLHSVCPRCTGLQGRFPSRNGRFCHVCGMKTVMLWCR